MKDPMQNALEIVFGLIKLINPNRNDKSDDNILIEPRPFICVQSSTESLKKASFNEVWENIYTETRKLSVK